MEYLKQIRFHLENNDLPSIVSLWEEYCMSDEIDLTELRKILELLRLSHLAEQFGVYVELILPLWERLDPSKAKDEIFRIIIDMETSDDVKLGERVYAYLKDRSGDQANFEQKIRMIGLRDRGAFRYSVSNFELLNHFKRGNFVFHTAGWGVGEIMDVSAVREQVSMEFDFVSGSKDLSFKNAFKTLIPLPSDNFLALRFGNPDALEERAKKQPVETIRVLLRDLGPKTAGEIKDEMSDLVIPEEEWAKWWQSTRTSTRMATT